MPYFYLVLKGFNCQHAEVEGLLKLVHAPSMQVIEKFIVQYKLENVVRNAEDDGEPGIVELKKPDNDPHEESDVDLILDEQRGKVVVLLGDKSIPWWAFEVEVAKRLVATPHTQYEGNYNDGNEQVCFDNKPFDHARSLKVRNHSPDGFAWGYAGSGPAQLALAILLNETGNPEIASKYYQDFKDKKIVPLEKDKPFRITSEQVHRWLAEAKKTDRIATGKKVDIS